jgi:hypothetical protein
MTRRLIFENMLASNLANTRVLVRILCLFAVRVLAGLGL